MFDSKKEDQLCPLSRKSCLASKCSWWIQLRGKSPQTGNDIDEFKCAISWLPILLIEVAHKEYQTGAAIESFRNETVKIAGGVINAACAKAAAMIIQPDKQSEQIGQDPPQN
jgi:hypothetical protein